MFKKPWWLGPVLIAAATVGAALVAAGGVLGHSVGRYRGSRAEQRRHARDAALKEEERAKVRRGNGELPKPTPSDEGAA